MAGCVDGNTEDKATNMAGCVSNSVANDPDMDG